MERGWGVVTERNMLLLLLPFRGAGRLGMDMEESGKEDMLMPMPMPMDMSSCLMSSIGEVGRRVWLDSEI